jgi:hypothetical protein
MYSTEFNGKTRRIAAPASPQMGWIEMIPQIIGSAASVFKTLFGSADKFTMQIYPIMLRLAQANNKTVFAFWFGDAIGVNPAGQSFTLQSGVPSIAAFVEILTQYADTHGDVIELTSEAGDSQLILGTYSGAGTVGGGFDWSSLVLPVAVLGGLYLVAKRGKK